MKSQTLIQAVSRHRVAFAGVVVSLWPLLFLFRFVVADQSFSLGIGNDFGSLYYDYKVYLLDYISHTKRLPLWSPSEAAGFPFFSNPFAQALYPLNVPLALFYSVAGGYSYHDHQIFTVIAYSIYALGLLFWLRELGTPLRAAVVATMIVSISFKLTETVRFPNAAHTAAWMPWLLYGLARSLNKDKSVQSAMLIFASIILITTGGYPYFTYYTLFLAGPYALLLLHPASRACIGPSIAAFRFSSYRRLVTVWGLGGGVASLLCLPYVLKIRALMALTADRTGDDFDYSTMHVFNLEDTIGSLLFPPASQTEGWYYFGILGLLIIVVYLVSFIWYREHPKLEFRRALILLIWCVLISLIVCGKSSPLFKLLWLYFPGFAQLRVWGRMNIILLPLIALLLCRAYLFLETRIVGRQDDDSTTKRESRDWVMMSIIVSYACIAVAQIFLHTRGVLDEYWTIYFPHESGDVRSFLFSGLSSFIVLSTAIFLCRRSRESKARRVAAFALLCVLGSALDMFPVGSKQWGIDPVDRPGRQINVQSILKQSLVTPRLPYMTTIAVSPAFHTGFIQNWYFQRYIDFYTKMYATDVAGPWGTVRVVNQEEESWFRILMGMNDGRRLFLSERIDHISIRDFIIESYGIEADGKASMTINQYTGDRLAISVDSTVPGYVSFIDNVDPDWRAYVNGEETHLEHLFGTFKSIQFPAGRSEIRFVYKPRYFKWLGVK